MLACRLCKIPMSAARGCDVCNGVRKNLVVVGEDEEDRPGLASTGFEVVGTVRRQAKRIDQVLRNDPDEETELKFERRLLALSNSLGKLLDTARKLQADGVDAVENMSFAERAELFITWITTLPYAYRQSLRDKWDEWEQTTAEPLSSIAVAKVKQITKGDYK